MEIAPDPTVQMQLQCLRRQSPLWVITSYFNPSGYRRRYQNFQVFRRHLNVPLLVVELTRDGEFELGPDDADIVLQLTGEDRIWQKERLLNIGAEHLPDHVDYVAWVDCDVVFDDPNWSFKAIDALDADARLIQLFQTLSHVRSSWSPPAESVDMPAPDDSFFDEESFCSRLSKEPFSHARFETKRPQVSEPEDSEKIKLDSVAHGLAWAAKRSLLSSCGLYDASIIGGGDRPLVYAAIALASKINENGYLSEAHWLHYMRWASRFHAEVDGKVGFLDQRAYHLWHGELVNRNYLKRHHIIRSRDFHPDRELEKSSNGTWKWADPNSQLSYDLATYFDSRREDG